MPDGTPYTDAVLTTRELVWMIKSYGIDFLNSARRRVRPRRWASPPAPGTSSAPPAASWRPPCAPPRKLTGKPPGHLEFTDVRGVDGLRKRPSPSAARRPHRRLQRLDQRQALLDKVERGGEAVPHHRDHGLPRRLRWRRRPALSAARHGVLDPKSCALRAQALYTIDSRQAAIGAPTRTRPSSNSTRISWAKPTARKPMRCCTPTTTPDRPGGSGERNLHGRHRRLRCTDNWTEVELPAGRRCRSDIVDFIAASAGRRTSESQLIAVLHMVQAAFGYLGQGANGRRGPARCRSPGQGHRGGDVLPLLPAAAQGQAHDQRVHWAPPAT